MEYLRELNMVSIIVRVVLAILIGGIMGFERGKNNHPAGFRTYILVCLGSALVMMTNQYLFNEFGTSDPARLGAQVISGIGFLGAGTIVLNGRNQIKGITTAASLWTAACSGLAIGIGFYEGALVGAFAIIFTVAGLQKANSWVRNHSKYLDIYIEYDESDRSFADFLHYAKKNGFEVVDLQLNSEEYIHQKNKNQNIGCYIITVVSHQKRTHVEMVQVLKEAQGINYIEALEM